MSTVSKLVVDRYINGVYTKDIKQTEVMKMNWNIYWNGGHYSTIFTKLRSQKHEQTVIATWKERSSYIPEGEIRAYPAQPCFLNNYGN
jgi:NMD protein affecting ribosome stability and mRNA decay